MWGDVLGLALLASLNPMLLGLILIMLSRPRPVQNLLAFWVGALIVNVPLWLGSLAALHWIPSFESFAHDMATAHPSSGIRPLQLGTGVFCVVVVILIATRMLVLRWGRRPVPVGADGDTSTLLLESDPQATVEPSAGRFRSHHLVEKVRGLFGRAKVAWESGAVWVSLLFGLAYIAPPPLILLVHTMIVGSGASLGTQIVAVLAFVFVMLAVLEVALLSYAVSPTRTQAVLEPIHVWAQAHRMMILLVLFAAVGSWQVVAGAGLI